MTNHRITATLVATLLAAGAILTAIGHPDREVTMSSVGELWADVFRDADQFGLQLSRVSVKDETDLGKKLAANLVRSQASVPIWEVYVQAVGRPLARHVRRKEIQYEFHVIDSNIRNAFALPGGQIFIYKGLLDAMQSEAELASVLGHEIAHVDARHAIERFQYQLRLKKFRLDDIGALLSIATQLLHVGYAQYQELEADALGLELSLAERYDPQGSIDLFARLPQSGATGYFESHPPSPKRISRLRVQIERYRWQHPGEHVYRGIENFRRRIPHTQTEFPAERVPL